MGFSPIFVRVADVPALTSGFYRLALALPVLWLISTPWQTETKLGPLSSRDRWLMLAAGLTFGADIAFWHLAIVNTTVTNAMLFGSLTPVMVAAGAFLAFGERPRPVFFAGLALALTGVATLALQRTNGAAPHPVLGNALGLGAAAIYAIYILIVSELRKRHSVKRIVLWSTVISALSLVPFAATAGGPLLPATLVGWAAVFGMALISHAGGQSFLTYALAHLPVSLSSMVQFLQVAVAAIAAWILLGETMTWIKLAGAAAILGGILLCRGASTKRA